MVASCPTTAEVDAVLPLFPSDEDHVYPVIVLPPFAGADQVTVSLPVDTPVVAVVTPGLAGAAGTVVTVTAEDADDAADVPEAFVAVTVAVTDAPEEMPPTTIGEDDPVPV